MSEDLPAAGAGELERVKRSRSGVPARLMRNPMGLGALVVLAIMVLLGLLAPVLSSHDPDHSSLQHVNAPIGTDGFPLGADSFGRDIWARLLASINVSLIAALIGTSIALAVGGVFGLVAGYVGKKTDTVSSWAANLVMAIPTLVMLIVLTPLTGGAYQSTMMILGFFLAPSVFRLVRNLVVGVRGELYVDAARVSGLSDGRIIARHVLYVIRGPIVIQAAFLATTCVALQAGLAFIGVGSQIPSFGTMISQAFGAMYGDPVQLLWPTLGLTLLTGAFVLFGNAYRDALAGPQNGAKRSKQQPMSTPRQISPANEEQGTVGAAAPEEALLRVRDLSVSYLNGDGSEKEVVHRISFDVGTSEIVGLVGESGSGKTQTAFAVLGLLPRDAAVEVSEISLAGRPLLDRNELRRARGRDIAYVPQEPMSNLDPSFTVGSQLVEGLRHSMTRAEARKTVLDLLERVGISDPKRTFGSYPHEISGGMAQRVLIAGAVASRPKLLIADEPTTALDVTVQAEILDLLRELQREFRMGVLLVTHNFGVVADLCERVIVMRHGRIVETGGVRDIFHAPEHPYTQELIDAILDESTLRADQPLLAVGGQHE